MGCLRIVVACGLFTLHVVVAYTATAATANVWLIHSAYDGRWLCDYLCFVAIWDYRSSSPSVASNPAEVAGKIGSMYGSHQVADLLIRPKNYDTCRLKNVRVQSRPAICMFLACRGKPWTNEFCESYETFAESGVHIWSVLWRVKWLSGEK